MFKNLILVLMGCLFASLSFAASGSGNVSNVIQFGGAEGSTVPSLTLPSGSSVGSMRMLTAFSATNTANHYLMLVNMGSPGLGGSYQVAAGKTLFCNGMNATTDGANQDITFGYGSAAAGSNDTASAPTNALVYAAPSAHGFRLNGATSTWFYYPISVSFPALSYPFIRTDITVGSVSLYNLVCFEE